MPANRSVGGELEAQWLPTDDLMLSLTYSHIDGDFEDYAPLVGPTTTINTNDLAKRLAEQYGVGYRGLGGVPRRLGWNLFSIPKCTGRARAMRLPCGPAPITASPTCIRKSSWMSALQNMRLGMKGGRSATASCAGLWAKNLTDEDYNTFGVNFASLGPINYFRNTVLARHLVWM